MSSLTEHYTLPDNPHLGDRVLYRMKRMGYKTKTQLAQTLGCGVGVVSKIINDGKCHDSHRLKLIAWHLGTTTDWLLGRVPDEKSKAAICEKSFCGENARWAVRRHGQHHSQAHRCCDNHVIHFISRDFKSDVYPLERFLQEHPDKYSDSVEVVISKPEAEIHVEEPSVEAGR